MHAPSSTRIDVPGRIDDVDPVFRIVAGHAFPESGGRSRRDRDAAFLLLLHPVHRGRTVVHFTDLVAHAGVKQDALGRRGLAGIDVSADPDVAIALDGGFAGHVNLLVVRIVSGPAAPVRAWKQARLQG